ncbi:TadE family protein [Microbacterium sp.]|uniref:TadE family protein n=1 Tax=Microbacterium sp. TaxID=51671 RepID=UPI0026228656|nr:TadE family protein [Microbacterium sp.]
MLRWSRSIADRLRSRLARFLREDDGSASLEFLTVGLLMLVPLIYVVVALGQIQHQALGAEAAARHVARAISLSSDAASAGSSASEVLSAVMAAYDLDASATSLSISCVPASASCPTAGATVRVSVATRVSLPLAPPVLGLDQIASVPVEASAVQRMSRFWSGG